MYEIWLALNVVWELVLASASLVAAGVVLWVVLMAAALRRRARGLTTGTAGACSRRDAGGRAAGALTAGLAWRPQGLR